MPTPSQLDQLRNAAMAVRGPRVLPETRVGTPEGRWCIAVLSRLSLEELRSLNAATIDARSDDEYLAAFSKWMERRSE
jgi:hypothetical protein